MIWGFAGISGSFLVAASSVDPLHAADSVYRLTFSQRTPRNARPHEVGEGRTVQLRWFHAGIHVLHGRVCFPRRSHLRLDDQRAAQSPCLAILVPWGCGGSSTTSFIPDLAGGRIPYPRSTGLDHAALHPFRRATPVTLRCTRYVALHPIRRGVMPTDRVHHLINIKLVRGFSRGRRPRRRPTAKPCSAALSRR